MTNKVVVVTGASSGIGQATALRLGGEGYRVLLAARRTDRLEDIAAKINADGGTAVARAVDVTDRADVAALVDAVVAEFGSLDVFVNNAGVMTLPAIPRPGQWDQMIDVNIRGLLHGIAALTLPHFKRQGAGTSSRSHPSVPTKWFRPPRLYCASKYAAWAITEGLRLESDPSIPSPPSLPVSSNPNSPYSISDPTAEVVHAGTIRAVSIPADSIASAISYAIGQPPDVDVNEIIVRPAGQR